MSEAATIPRQDKLFFAAVGALALWVAAWGWLVPGAVDWALPWLVPPLHARFLAAMYLSGATFMAGALLAGSWPTVRVVAPMIGVWTGTLFIVSVLHLADFDFGRPQAWVWFAAYLAYPLIAAWIAWRMRHNHERGDGPAVSWRLRGYLVAQGILFVVLAAALLFFPGSASTVWPWAISPLLAQIYAAPFLSYGLGSLYAARQRVFGEVWLFLLGTALFGIGVLLASVLHWALFSTANLSTWVWFVGFGVLAIAQSMAVGATVARGSVHLAPGQQAASEE